MPPEFQPSDATRSVKTEVLAALHYIEKVAHVLAKHVEEHGEPPAWVQTQILSAVHVMARAASYLDFVNRKFVATKGKKL